LTAITKYARRGASWPFACLSRTARLDVVKAADVARLTQEDFDRERNKMIAVCEDCHSRNFALGELAKADDLIRTRES
jgi:hypothetical protein